MQFQETVSLDWALPAGAVIGKKGRNVRWIGQESGGARLDVSDDRVVVRARSRAVVDSAVRLLRAQIEANKRLVSPAYPHPLRVDHVLTEDGFGRDPRVRFRSCEGNAAALATGKWEPLFILSPDTAVSGGRVSSAADVSAAGRVRVASFGVGLDSGNLAGLLAGMSLRQGGGVGRATAGGGVGSCSTGFHSSSNVGAAMSAALADAAHAAAANQPPFDILKIRLNLGKQYFYNLGGLEHRSGLTLDDIQGLNVGAAGLSKTVSKTVFSNHIPPDNIPRITAWLENELGFSLVDTKSSATLHVIDDRRNVHYAVALTLLGDGAGGGGAVKLRKVKSSATKCHMVVLQGGPSQLDMRLKLLGQRRDLKDDKASAVAEQIVQRCNRLGYDAATGHGRGGAAAGLLPESMTLDVARKKTKRVFEGTFRATPTSRTLRVKLTVVEVEEGTGDRHSEITGAVPELDNALAELLQQEQRAVGRHSRGGSDGGGGGDTSGSDSGCGPGWAAEAVQGLEALLRVVNAGLEREAKTEP